MGLAGDLGFLIFFLTGLVLAFGVWKTFKKKKTLDQTSTILITGGCLGLGRETALQFATKHNCHIIVLDIRANLADSLLQEIKNAGGKGYFFECDVSDKLKVETVFQEVHKQFPKIDILINNAAIVVSKKVEDFSLPDIQEVMNVNFFGPFIVTKQVLPNMKRVNAGHIVTVASIAAHLYTPDTSIYAASKSALFTLFSALRLELKRDKSQVKTTLVCPWIIDTGMFEGFKVPFTFFGLLNFLKTKRVAETVYNGIVCEREEIYTPFYQQIVFRIILMLPSWISDFFNLWLSKDSMKGFVGRKKVQ